MAFRSTGARYLMVGIPFVSNITDVLWQIGEHEKHRRCKCLTVLKPLLLDEDKKINVLE